jgi:seryl-tRNA(Sec) selenium transferase
MLSAILAILGSSTVGSLIGGIFAFLNKKADIEIKKLDQAHELELRKEDRELAKVEAEGRLQVAVAEAEGSIESARMTDKRTKRITWTLRRLKALAVGHGC